MKINAKSLRRLVGPVFVVLAILSPGVIASFQPASIANPPAWLGAAFAIQRTLLTTGVSLGVLSAIFWIYHIQACRRIVHLLLFFCLLELFYRLAYGGPVSPGLLLSVGETSGRETLELLAGHPLLTAGLTLFAVLAACSVICCWRGDIRFSRRACLLLGFFAAAMLAAALVLNLRQQGDIRATGRLLDAELRASFPLDIADSLGSVVAELLDARREAATRASYEFSNARLLNAAARQDALEIYVVVIGETSRRANWSLFGYSRPTNPRLDAIRDSLILFAHMTSNATTTILSLPLALTRASATHRGVARSEKSVVSLLRQAGFETFWISNQERSVAMTNSISQIAAEADHVSFPEDSSALARSDGFDSNLLIRLDDEMKRLRPGGKAVLFLHMEGSHYGYADRYPAAFRHFGAQRAAPRTDSGGRLRLVDEYDNSVLFTDHNLRGVIDRLSACGCKSGLVFFSDHGERLFDNGVNDGDFGHGFPSVSRREIEIPFILWLSAAYRQANAMSVGRLKNNTQSFVQLHNLFETVVDLAGVDYDGRHPSLSLFSERLERTNTLEVLNIAEETLALPLRADANEELISRDSVAVQE